MTETAEQTAPAAKPEILKPSIITAAKLGTAEVNKAKATANATIAAAKTTRDETLTTLSTGEKTQLSAADQKRDETITASAQKVTDATAAVDAAKAALKTAEEALKTAKQDAKSDKKAARSATKEEVATIRDETGTQKGAAKTTFNEAKSTALEPVSAAKRERREAVTDEVVAHGHHKAFLVANTTSKTFGGVAAVGSAATTAFKQGAATSGATPHPMLIQQKPKDQTPSQG